MSLFFQKIESTFIQTNATNLTKAVKSLRSAVLEVLKDPTSQTWTYTKGRFFKGSNYSCELYADIEGSDAKIVIARTMSELNEELSKEHIEIKIPDSISFSPDGRNFNLVVADPSNFTEYPGPG